MSDSDKMRAEFEAVAKAKHLSIQKNASGSYVWGNTYELWRGFQLGYAAGQKAERETIRKLISPEVIAPIIELLGGDQTKH